MKKKRAKKVEKVKQERMEVEEEVTQKKEQQAFHHPLSAWDDLVFAKRIPSPSSEVEPTTEEVTKEKVEEDANKRGWSWI
ncbi:hypothetical protein BKP35_13380 [Anaerobacillus arseniciselenatis]|uniref:Uncharacterized protein n=1 Tax=Anaerobacillus arseniciselenatis TaxID=85682 RepID=A0A1S2LDE5_9BACI|nr:hypothetical protein [Anaerobacillus arseniciselenatis]OIJ10103.1 hypothetical protein BKP35_13380 [Anaerobacillus arseniciselenatis]